MKCKKSPILLEPFRAARWLPGPHLQTLWGAVTRGHSRVRLNREVLPLPDGDLLYLDHLEGPPESPRVLLLHGLEGSSNSVYIQGLLVLLARKGFRATALNFRTCARDPGKWRRWIPNLRPRMYHSGETTDFDFTVRSLNAREPHTPLFAIGVSLGGNVLLKWLGEHGSQTAVSGAVTLSVPYDLAAGARHMENPVGRVYIANFLRTLRPKVAWLVSRFPQTRDVLNLERINRARSFYAFDDAATAPLHGFLSADDYYEKSSSLSFLPEITTPTLCISSEDDPFVPAEALFRARSVVPPTVTFVVTPSGGHTGFVSGWPWRIQFWAEEMAVRWLESC